MSSLFNGHLIPAPGAKLPHFHNKKKKVGRSLKMYTRLHPFLSISLFLVVCPTVHKSSCKFFFSSGKWCVPCRPGFLFPMLAARGKLTSKHWADSISCQFSTFLPGRRVFGLESEIRPARQMQIKFFLETFFFSNRFQIILNFLFKVNICWRNWMWAYDDV